MGATCCGASPQPAADPRWRRILWIALGINAGMFGAELAAGMLADSVSLAADAMDFLSDAVNYAISLAVIGMTLRWRARAALVKGASLGILGLWVAATTAYHAVTATVPEAHVMGGVGLAALVANLAVAAMLYAYRSGDSNMRSVWLCSRNDAIGNVAVMLAASGVLATGAGWPDILVAAIMAGLAVTGAVQIIRHAAVELNQTSLAQRAG